MRLLNSFIFLVSVVCVANALPKVSRGGRYLYLDGGNRFYIKGIAYQHPGNAVDDPNNSFPEPGDFTDPLSDPEGCSRDLPFLQQLKINTIRVYSVDSSLNHDACMQALSQAGIYTIIDLALPVNGSINRIAPSWDTSLLDLYLKTVDAFSKYDNVLAYNIGNEVVAQTDQFPNATAAAPFVKAAARDVKAYLKSKNLNTLVGYASTDGPSDWRGPLAKYLGCGSEETSVDIYGLNNYEWCGDSNFESSYSQMDSEFADLNIPAYFSEFGCPTSPPRLWTEVQALFGPQMTDHWSGGVAFTYFPDQDFGMVTLSPDNKTVTVSDDFNRLADQYSNVTFINSPSQSGAGQTQYPQCAPPSPPGFLAADSLPPTPNDAACQCLRNKAFSCLFKETNSPQQPAIVGSLLDNACSLLGQQGQNCNPIGASGSAGTYGSVSFCDPVTKLDFALSSFYEITDRNPQSCDFSGNATVVPSPAANASAAATSCLSNADATFTPTSPAGSGSGSGSGGGTSNGNGPSSGPNDTGDSAHLDINTLSAVVVTTIFGCLGGALTVFA